MTTELKLEDLAPVMGEMELSRRPGVKLHLKPVSLRTQIWMKQRFTNDEIEGIFERVKFPEISEIVFHLLVEKDQFPQGLEDFQDAILTQADRVSMLRAIFHCVGVSQPVIDKTLQEYDEKNAHRLSQVVSTGAPSST